MVPENKYQIAEEFQRVFTERYSKRILALIQETREEAFEDAKRILKAQTVRFVLTSVYGEATPSSPLHTAKEQAPDEGEVEAKNVLNASTRLPISDDRASNPALSDRILKEIEAIRDQIQRNEKLLSQIKPLIRSSITSEDNS